MADDSTRAPRFPGANWETRDPAELGFDTAKLTAARDRLAQAAAGPPGYRVCVVRGGYLVAEWREGIEPTAQLPIASAAKSVYSCLLGIAVAEGRIPSADAPVSEYYPEMLDVPEGAGPKPGRGNKPEDALITFRQLITNTSGYLKPGERPGDCFHYQTYGMNIVMHALGKVYGVYDASDPEGSVGPGEIIREKIRDPIGGTWTWRWANFDLWPAARLGIFGYYTGLATTCRDLCRLGWLWRNGGAWAGRQVVPRDWLREATRSASVITRDLPGETGGVGVYGHAFWTNDTGKLWPNLPRDSFAACGAGNYTAWVSPSLDLVIAQSPGPPTESPQADSRVAEWVIEALSAP